MCIAQIQSKKSEEARFETGISLQLGDCGNQTTALSF